MRSLTKGVGFCAQLPDHERENCFFQQDDATCHTSRDSMARVHEAGFKGHIRYYFHVGRFISGLFILPLCRFLSLALHLRIQGNTL
jgi:hypothetical protein